MNGIRNLTVFVLAAACGVVPTRVEPCTPIINTDAVLAAGTVVFFGEIHGTEQSPAFVGDVLCNAVARRLPTTLALEWPNQATEAIERYVRSNGDSTSRALLLANDMWHALAAEGRTSRAMFALIETARTLRSSGADVDVLAFSHVARTGAVRDSLMARTVVDFASAHPERVMIGLAGNVHSSTTIGARVDSTFRPMAYLIGVWLPGRRVLGLNASHTTGTAWICTSDPKDSCGPHVIPGNMIVPSRTVVLGASRKGYDGLYGIGALTASPPATP